MLSGERLHDFVGKEGRKCPLILGVFAGYMMRNMTRIGMEGL